MGAYIRGEPIQLPAKFWVIDPITREPTLVNPATVVYTIVAPDQTSETFNWPGNPAITNPDVGIFVLDLGSDNLPVGEWKASAVGTSPNVQTTDDVFTIYESAADVPAPPPRPVIGPCSQWISGEDVAACAQVDPGGDIVLPGGTIVKAGYLFDTAAYNATIALYEISNRRFPGICERKVRPCQTDCACGPWGAPASSGWGGWVWGWGAGAGWGYGGPWGWWNERGDHFGCQPVSKWRLAGYPVVEIVEVLIDGEELPEFDPDTGARNWRLDRWRFLVRMDKPAAGEVPSFPQFWPSCQNMSLDDDQPGTFSVRYRWGMDVPQLGRDAAVEIANQLFLACGGAECILPAGVTKVVRQGIEIDRGLLANWMDPTKGVGLVQTDLFLQAFAGGSKVAGRRSALWSPDVQQYARRVGVNE